MFNPFVVIKPYQFDGDAYNDEELARSWHNVVLLKWSELEARIKRPNDPAHPTAAGGTGAATCCALAEDCESCGNETGKKTAMLASCGTGLSVCDKCKVTLEAIGWKSL